MSSKWDGWKVRHVAGVAFMVVFLVATVALVFFRTSEGYFRTEVVPVSDGQLECVVFDTPRGGGIDCNWPDRRTSD